MYSSPAELRRSSICARTFRCKGRGNFRMSDDIPLQQDLRPHARPRDGSRARRARDGRQQSRARSPSRARSATSSAAARSRLSIPAPMTMPISRRCSTPCAARPSRISSSPTPIATIRRPCPRSRQRPAPRFMREGPHRPARPLHIGEAAPARRQRRHGFPSRRRTRRRRAW